MGEAGAIQFGNKDDMKKPLLILTSLVFAASTAFADGMKMQIEGKDWAATVINATQLKMGATAVINISGKLEGSKISMLAFQLAPTTPDKPVGHYELKTGLPKAGFGSGTFNVDLLGGNPMEDGFSFQSGILDVTAYDPATHALTGTFSGVAENHSGSKKANVRNGVLDAVGIGP